MAQTAKDRRLIGTLWTSDDDSACYQPIIEEHWLQRKADVMFGRCLPGWEERIERVWEGTFLTDPSSWEIEDLKLELEEQCRKLGLEQDPFDPSRWEREL